VDIELTPEQPDAVESAIEALVEPPPRQADAWWQAGLDDALSDET
jgi:hypothetical protein